MSATSKKKDKVNLIRVGIICLIVAIALFVFGGKKVINHLQPAEYISDLSAASLHEGQKISFDADNVLGICYYDSSRGIVSENQVDDDIYGEGYAIALASKDADGNIALDSLISIEVDSKRLYSQLDAITNDSIFSDGMTVSDASASDDNSASLRLSGQVMALDMNRYTDLYAFMVIQKGHSMSYSMQIADVTNITLADGSQGRFYIYIDDPVDDYIVFIVGIGIIVVGIVLISKGLKEKKTNKASNS